MFRTPENLKHYSKQDYQAPEREFLKKLDPDVPCVKHPEYGGKKPPPYKCARCESIYCAVQTACTTRVEGGGGKIMPFNTATLKPST